MGIVLAIFIFGFIIFFHELGHFLLAKRSHIDVTEFSVGMGPILLAKEHKGTKYCLKLLPFGGSCMMGEDEEATDAPGSFHNKSVWARMSVIVAGAVFNFILAFILATILVGMIGFDKPVVGEVDPGYPAAEAGLKEGDLITKINGKSIKVFRELSYYNQLHQGSDMSLTFKRGDQEETIVVHPQKDEERGYYRFGIASNGYTKGNLFDAVKYGAYEVRFWIKITFESLKMLVTGQVGINELSGPVGIVDVVDNTYQQSKAYGVKMVIVEMLNLAILISANLGVMNLLPLPALDGGRLVFLIIEAIRGKKIPPEKEGIVHTIGIILLMVLMVFVMFNDIRKVFF
ncbi:MAG TPA: RIP metalloprotease RseP [Candidatus Dorea intestinavium]|nr:RIP metalloprotease RseP [Candidatus Dorea intestinavium]